MCIEWTAEDRGTGPALRVGVPSGRRHLQESKASSRILTRKDKSGQQTPYYDYRDTAMSRLAPFKPEWIQQLRQVQDNDPLNPEVQYNNGHLMMQTSIFIGQRIIC